MLKTLISSPRIRKVNIRLQKERRGGRRNVVTPRQLLPVVIRSGRGSVYQGRVLNLSLQGMLVEFAKDQLPTVPMDTKVSVKLHYLGDSIWIPGVVRHRRGTKMGFYFPDLTKSPIPGARHPLQVVLHSLSRAVSTS